MTERTPENVPDPSDGYEDGILPTPTDTPTAVNSYGTTGAEEAAGEPLEVKLRRETPDVGETTGEGTAAPVDRSEQTGGIGGRLVQPDEGAHGDREKDEVADLVDDDEALTVEEQAIHLEPER